MVSGLHGYLVIDKPAGWTSHDVVGRLRRLLGERRVGHAGTLDPAATGVLPIAVGAATKTLKFLEGASKTYLAELTFGIETDSYDGDGTVTAIADASGLSADAVRQALATFLGSGQQVPPMHSAVRIGGQRLYEAARRGQTIDRPARPVTFFALELVAWDAPTATVLIDCSKGTYVRSLAYDLGRAVGTGAYLSDLIRLRSGPFDLCEAWTLADLADVLGEDRSQIPLIWPDLSLHPDVPLEDLPALILDRGDAERWSLGQRIVDATASQASEVDDRLARAYDAEGNWLGVGQWDPENHAWRPAKVVAAPRGDAAVLEEGQTTRG